MVSTPDLCDGFEDRLADGSIRVLDAIFERFGAHQEFSGQVLTVKCFEDNSKVKELANTDGLGRVMVVDGGGSMRRALLGDMIAANAVAHGWAGFIFNGAIRDVEVINSLAIGVRCLGVVPVKTEKKGLGSIGEALHFAGQRIHPGDWVYADQNGVLVSDRELILP